MNGYRRQQLAIGQTAETNPSMVPWDILPEALRSSNYRQADHIGVKLNAINCGIIPVTDWQAEILTLDQAEIEQLAEVEHQRWNEERFEDGWHFAPGPKTFNQRPVPIRSPGTNCRKKSRNMTVTPCAVFPPFSLRPDFRFTVCLIPNAPFFRSHRNKRHDRY